MELDLATDAALLDAIGADVVPTPLAQPAAHMPKIIFAVGPAAMRFPGTHRFTLRATHPVAESGQASE
ncbi:MAG TPA: hypothetical protein VK481_09550, partial [Gemmatimonadaceae bacterium]|nr:hypothetical protein [Gemmatimonadaceae bacterium]